MFCSCEFVRLYEGLTAVSDFDGLELSDVLRVLKGGRPPSDDPSDFRTRKNHPNVEPSPFLLATPMSPPWSWHTIDLLAWPLGGSLIFSHLRDMNSPRPEPP